MKKKRFFRSGVDKSHLARNELRAMILCNSVPGVVSVEGAFQTAGHIHFLMPYYRGGDLFDRLVASGGEGLPVPLAVSCLKDVLTALERMHSKGLCHRDLKLENVYVNGSGRCVLGDLGMVIEARRPDWCGAGSLGYRAPEVIRRARCGPASDVYSLGIFFFALLFGALPWSTTRERLELEKVREGEDIFSHACNEPGPKREEYPLVYDFLEKTLALVASERSTLSDLRVHEVFTLASEADSSGLVSKRAEESAPPVTVYVWHPKEAEISPQQDRQFEAINYISASMMEDVERYKKTQKLRDQPRGAEHAGGHKAVI